MKKPIIFMVEDELSVLAANKRMLQRRGYDVFEASNVIDALTYLKTNEPDLLILDIMLPDGSGYDICKEFRKMSDNPIIFLTGKTDVKDKVEGLDLGGDYYLTKPYQFEEMLAIVRRLLERKNKLSEKNETVIQVGPLKLDFKNSLVTLNDETISLTGKEFGLLSVFMQNQNNEFSGEELYEKVWGVKNNHDIRTIRKHIMNLRSKIHAAEYDDYDIVTSYGKGYTFYTKN